MRSTRALRWTLVCLLAAALAGCTARPGAPDGGVPTAGHVDGSDPAGDGNRPADFGNGPAGEGNGPAGDGDGPAGDSDGQAGPGKGDTGGESALAAAEEAARGELTMLDCLQRFGLAGLGPAVQDLLQGLPSDELWQCVARTARADRAYRAAVAYDILVTGGERIDTSLPGYQAFARTTELDFGEARNLPAPDGWTLLDALPSPSGRYVAARLAGGGVGWWAVDGSAHERYDAAGYDLVWHPAEDQLAFISDGNRMHLVRPGGPVVHQVFEAPSDAPVRFPYWALQEWHAASGSSYPPGTVLVLADPEGEPEGLALRPDSGRWERFPAKQIFAPGSEVVFPAWLTQPWSAGSGDYLHVDRERGLVAYPNRGGSAYTFYQVPEDAEPVFLTWSPGAGFFAVVERREGRLAAQLLRASGDYRGEHFSIPLESADIAIWDDGVTAFTAAGQTVTAKNHLTGAERTWQVEGEVRGIRLGRHQLYIILADRLVAAPFTEATAVSAAPGAEQPADAAQK